MATQKKTDTNPFETIRRAVKDRAPAFAYIFSGEESYLKEAAVKELRSLIEPGMDDFNLFLFDSTFEPDELVNAIEAVPVFSSKKLIVIRDFNAGAPPQKYAQALERIFDSPPGYAMLVFLYDRLEYTPPKTSSKPEWFDSVVNLNFTRPEEQALFNWIIRRFNAGGRKCARSEAEYLCYVSGGLMSALIPEIDKLSAYRPGEPVTREDIDAVATRSVDAEIYKITDAICARDAREALRLTSLLLENRAEPLAILNALSRASRQMYGARLIIDAKKGGKELMELFQIRYSFIASNLLKNAGRFSRVSLARWLMLCLEADRDIKTTSRDDGLIIELLVTSISAVRP